MKTYTFSGGNCKRFDVTNTSVEITVSELITLPAATEHDRGPRTRFVPTIPGTGASEVDSHGVSPPTAVQYGRPPLGSPRHPNVVRHSVACADKRKTLKKATGTLQKCNRHENGCGAASGLAMSTTKETHTHNSCRSQHSPPEDFSPRLICSDMTDYGEIIVNRRRRMECDV